jgi:hypothetical protein
MREAEREGKAGHCSGYPRNCARFRQGIEREIKLKLDNDEKHAEKLHTAIYTVLDYMPQGKQTKYGWK